MENITSISNITGDDIKYPLSGMTYKILGICLLCTFVCGTITNTWALLCFVKFQNLRSTTNMFIASLVASDFCMSWFGMPWSMTSNLAGKWLWGDIGCTIEAFIVYFAGLTQMYNLAAISFDRYIVIAKPLHASKITTRVCGLAICSCWLGGLFWSSMPILGWNHFVYDAQGTSCTIAIIDEDDPGVQTYNMAIFFMVFILPISVMGYSYFGVFMTLRNVTRGGVWDMNSRVAKRNLKIEKKMAKTIAIMLGVFLGTWMPYAITFFWAFFGDATSIPTVTVAAAAILAKTGPTWNPMIYCVTNKIFRIAFIKLMPCSGLRDSLLAKEEGGDDSDDEGEVKEPTKQTAVEPVTEVSIKD